MNGRSMEFGLDLRTQIYIRGQGIGFELAGVEASETMPATPKYSYVGMSSFGLPFVTDGINVKGLSAGALWLPGSRYQARGTAPGTQNVLMAFFVDWLLGHCATVADIKAAFADDSVRVIGDTFVAKFGPLHFTVHDATGASLVIEFVEGQAKLYDNQVRVLTNLPVYPWQIANLGLYAHLTPWDPDSVTLGGLTLAPPGSASGNPGIPGHGAGLAGIPGNYQPASRFVRTAYMKEFALPAATADEAVDQAFHLLNGVDIVKGAARAKTKSGGTEYDMTQWVVVKDLTNLRLFVRMYGSPMVYSVDLRKIDFPATKARQVPIPSGQLAIPIEV
ncbi:MAG: linear amide C-N hydrolase [Tagaea sp.]|nr:linear amide C-N hydrolase [Tagaea sp.]